jgi:hypothetical protein
LFFNFSSCLPPLAASQPSKHRLYAFVTRPKQQNTTSFRARKLAKKPPKMPNVFSEILLKQTVFQLFQLLATSSSQPAGQPAPKHRLYTFGTRPKQQSTTCNFVPKS